MRPVSTGDALRQDAEPQALQRLRSRRLIVAAGEPGQAEALAEALCANGASAIALGGPDSDLDGALALDADAILVLEADPSGSACEPILEALRGHPRARWASVIRVASVVLASEPTRSFALASIASHVVDAAATGVELAVRAKGKLPHTTQLQPLGMNRVLRVLADTHRTLRVALSGAWGLATVELHEGRVLGVRVEFGGSQPPLSDLQALATLLSLSEAQLRLEPGGARGRGWNVPVAVALARASALAHPDRPQIAWAQPETMPEIEVSTSIDPPDPAAEAQEHLLDGTVSGTRQRSDLAVTLETPLVELIAHVEASRAPVAAAPELTASTPARPARSRGKLVAGACIALAAVLGLAFFVQIDSVDQESSRSTRAPTRQLPSSATPIAEVPAPQPEAPAPTPAPAAIPSADTEPAEAAAPTPENAVPEVHDPQPGQLKEAQLLVKRARRHRRAGQLERAEASYLEAAAKLANYPLAMAGLARVYLDRKNGVEAVRWAEKLVKLQPNRDSYQLLLGDAYALRGNRAEAEQAWQRAMQLGSRSARKRLETR